VFADIFYRQDDQLRAIGFKVDPAGIQEHAPFADIGEIMLDLKIIKTGVVGENVLQ